MPRPDLICLVLVTCIVLAGCNDTRDLAPASPTTPWVMTGTTDPAPAGAPAFGVPADAALPWHEAAAADIDPAHSYSLVELIDLAQRRNKETRIAWEQARQAAIAVGIARAAFLPEITASALGGYQRIASPFPSSLVKQGYITANAQEVFPELAIRYLLLDFGGGREAGERAAQQISLAANVGFNGAHQQLIYTVASAYFTLDGVNAQLAAARQALTDARALQQAAEALQGRGLATVVVAQQALRGAAQAVYTVTQAISAQHSAMYSLLQALELPPTTKLLVEDSSGRKLARTTLHMVDQMMDDALRQRADLLVNLAKLRAADAQVDEARSAFDPKLSVQTNVQGNFGRISVDAGRYESVAQPQAGVFLRFDWPLYQGGLRQNRVRLAESQRDAAQDALEQASNTALRQVAQAYDRLQTGLSQYDAAVALRTAARIAYASASDAFAHGVGSFDDAVNSQTALAAAEATVASAHAQSLVDAAGLAFATGSLTSATAPALSVFAQ